MRKTLFFLTALALFACTKTEDEPIPSNITSDTCYVLNEGAFGQGNADVSLYSSTSKTIRNNVFYSTNGRKLGDVLQSGVMKNGKIYFILNNSNKIEIANSSSMLQLGSITGLSLPRYIAFTSNDIAWVSCWGNGGYLKKINVSSKQVLDSVKTGSGPEEISIIGNRMFVANSGGFANDSTISVINMNTGVLEQNLNVGDNPISLQTDVNGKLWVLCKGKVLYDANWNVIGHTSSKLVEINPTNLQIEKTITLFADKHPGRLQINLSKNILYFGSGYDFQGIFRLAIEDQTFNGTTIIPGLFYGFNISPKTGKIFCLKAPSFTVNGRLEVYGESGELLDNQSTGIGPNSVIF